MTDKLESLKHDYDSYKHITTLGTAAIVLMTAFLEKVFSNREWKPMVVVSLLSLLLSVVASVISMFGVSAIMGYDEGAHKLTLATA